MWWFILSVAVLNMAAGFGLAVILAGQCAAHDEPRGCDAAAEYVRLGSSETLHSAEGATKESEEAVPPATREEPVAEARSDGGVSSGLEGAGDPADSGTMADLDAAVVAAMGDVTAGKSEGETSSSVQEELAGNHGDEALLAFQSQLGDFCEELVALDDRLRRKPPTEMAELKSHLDEFAVSNQKQDETCRDIEESLRGMITVAAIGAKEGEAMIAAIREERREAAETVESFGALDGDGNVMTQCEMVLDRTSSLLDANYDLRDSMCDMISCSDSEGREDGGRNGVDPLTGILSRAGFDGILAEHWEKDPHRIRPVSLIMIDLDAFAKLNRKFGAAIGDRVLRAVAQLLKSESPQDCHVARFAGQRFALLAIDRLLKQAVGDAEHLRQTIELVHLEYGADVLRITVSCGVVAVTPEDTQASLYARSVESVLEAKRYGRNRCFMHEGEFPTPVVPPNLALSEKYVTV